MSALGPAGPWSRVWSEFLGTCGLLLVVVGSGIMGETLAPGQPAITLLVNSIATGAGLYALITTFRPISGAHFNPVVSGVSYLNRAITRRALLGYLSAQFLGAVAGVVLAHLIFGQSLLRWSTRSRGDWNLIVSEGVATLILVLVIEISSKRDPRVTPAAVATWIAAAYWCTSSTSFANPAVTLARSLTDSFSGIALSAVPAFIGAQIMGAVLAQKLVKRL